MCMKNPGFGRGSFWWIASGRGAVVSDFHIRNDRLARESGVGALCKCVSHPYGVESHG